MSIWRRLFTKQPPPRPMLALYGAVVNKAREPHWYTEGRVADTIDGRFDMLALVLVLVLRRLDREGEPLRQTAVDLTERFIEDMDGQMRQIGVGDFVVGKYVGKLMGALGGRIDAYNAGLEEGGDLEAALIRNLYRGDASAGEAAAYVAGQIRALAVAIDRQPLDALLAGEIMG